MPSFTTSVGAKASTVHPDYSAMVDIWTESRALLAGERAVKGLGSQLLPALNESECEGDYSYDTYLANAVYFNAVGLTYHAFIGMIFRKSVQIGDKGSATNDLLKNIDLEGSTDQSFCRDVAEEVMGVGRVGILQDRPSAPDGLTIKEREMLGIRSYLKIYKAETITNWKYIHTGGVKKPVSVTLTEEIEEDPENPFSHAMTVQRRVLRIANGQYIQEVYDKSDELVSSITPTDENGRPMNELPFVCINASTVGLDIELPPLEDLMSMNKAHYRASGSLGACIFMFGRSTPIFHIPHALVADFKSTVIEYGVTKSIILPTDIGGAKVEAGFLEPTRSMEPVSTHMKTIESRMASMGARMLTEAKAVAESPDTVNLDLIGEFSMVSALAANTSIGLTKAFSLLIGTETPVTLNTDYIGKMLDANMVTALIGAVQSGVLSKAQFQDSLQRGEVILAEDDIQSNVDYTKDDDHLPSDKGTVAVQLVDNKTKNLSGDTKSK